MPITRHIIIHEGLSERAYLQALQSFLEKQPLDGWKIPLRFIFPKNARVGNGKCANVLSTYRNVYKENKRESSIQILVDFDTYHRNDQNNQETYQNKPAKIPDFLFSFHNFEDFLALHFETARFESWKQAMQVQNHFQSPLHKGNHLSVFKTFLPSYDKGSLPVDFLTRHALQNLKKNKNALPISPHPAFPRAHSFADFLINEIDSIYPSLLTS